jgi:L-alanine-DL-glutamate epimerase-like enolase superfamily enzyme
MNLNRRRFGTFLAGAVGSFAAGPKASAGPTQTPAPHACAAARLSPAIITQIRIFYPLNYNPNGPQAFPQSNMVVLVDTDAGITGIGQGGSPDTVRNVARSVIGKNAFDTEMIWQAAFMDGFYSPGKGTAACARRDRPRLVGYQGEGAERAALPAVRRQGARTSRALCHIGPAARAGSDGRSRIHGLEGPCRSNDRGRLSRLSRGRRDPPEHRARRRCGPSRRGGSGAWRGGGGGVAGRGGGGRGGSIFDSRSRIRLIIQAVEQIREGVGPDGNWMIDLHQKFDFHEAVEVCRLMEPYRPFCVEDPVREEQFRTQIPKLRLLTTVPLAPGEEWGTRAEFSPLVERRDIDFARASLPNVGGITEMLKIMAMCDAHKVGIVPHFTGPIATAGHMNTMMAFPGQVLMEYNQGERPVPYLPEFLECRNGKVWPNDRPGLGVSVDETQLTFIESMTEGAQGITHRRPDGSLTHW